MVAYDNEHRRAAAAWKARWQPGDLCPRCHHATQPGDRLELDHDDDGNGYLGLSHASPCQTCGKRCNQRAGGLKAARRAGKRARERQCVVCGKPFTAPRGRTSALQETCGWMTCRAELRRRRAGGEPDGEPPPVTGRVW